MLGRALFASPLRTPFWVARFVLSAIRERSGAFLRFQPGYHGSTIPSRRFIEAHRAKLFRPETDFDGINLNRAGQAALHDRLLAYYPDFRPPANKAQGRYHYDNPMFGFPDAFVLYAMFREFQPRRVIEVGSGFSSALMLDMAREFLPETRFTFIDPYSTTIQDVLRDRPKGHYALQRTEVQEIDLQVFQDLGPGDVLFVDTSHAVKIGSDVSDILFRILPSLRPGVLIHIHDIYCWEYPENFVLAGRTYNESYFVRAFLQFNDAFEILHHSAQMERERPEAYPADYFKPAGQQGGQSLWLRKTR